MAPDHSSQASLLGPFEQLLTRFDSDHSILWYYADPTPRPCMTWRMVREIQELQKYLQANGGRITIDGTEHEVHYLVYASASPEVFNLGGDLEMFLQCVRSSDPDTLLRYALDCVDVLHTNYLGLDLPLTTISMIRGDALGGGFESALSSSVIVAEKSSQMGFPEALFDLFPGVGGYSLVARRLGTLVTERMISSARIYTAAELHDIGLVDVLADDGQGERAVIDYVRKHAKRRNAEISLHSVRRRYNPLNRDELVDIATLWAEAAMRLTDRDMKVVERLLRAQQTRSVARGTRPATSGQRAS